MPNPPTQGKEYVNWQRLTPTPSPHGAVYVHGRDPQSGDHLLAFGYSVKRWTRPVRGTAILEIPPSELARVPEVGALLETGHNLARCLAHTFPIDPTTKKRLDEFSAALAAWECFIVR